MLLRSFIRKGSTRTSTTKDHFRPTHHLNNLKYYEPKQFNNSYDAHTYQNMYFNKEHSNIMLPNSAIISCFPRQKRASATYFKRLLSRPSTAQSSKYVSKPKIINLHSMYRKRQSVYVKWKRYQIL